MRGGIRMLAPAKLNLLLSVGPRSGDGYHEVRTVLQAISLWDRILLADDAELTVRCSDPRIDGGPRNLAWRAADALRTAAGLDAGATIHVRKGIPAEAGLGGGSADAAAVLVGCNRLWGLHWSLDRLAAVAAGLGADVPFFLAGGTALGEGRGDRLTPLPTLPPWPVVVACPAAGSPTGAAYAALDALGDWRRPSVADALAECRRATGLRSRAGRLRLAGLLANSFEDALLPARPDIAALKHRLAAEGAAAALLCGSGSAVWALAPSLRWAGGTAARLRADGVWARVARFEAGGVRGAFEP